MHLFINKRFTLFIKQVITSSISSSDQLINSNRINVCGNGASKIERAERHCQQRQGRNTELCHQTQANMDDRDPLKNESSLKEVFSKLFADKGERLYNGMKEKKHVDILQQR